MGTIGTIAPDIVNKFKLNFDDKCVELLEWACLELKTKKAINADWGEENITANLYMLIRESQKSIENDIFLECEHPFFDQEILDNKKKAKGAPCIDLVFQHNWHGQRFSFYFEAKNLIENNVKKTNCKTETKASRVLKRYIETGIDHYLTSYYPFGCLLGYVLNGTISGVVKKLNAKLTRDRRSGEILTDPSGSTPWMSFQSQHLTQGKLIKHYFFDFN